MTRPKVVTKEELDSNKLSRVMEKIENIPEPTYTLNIGEEVSIGNIKDAKIIESLENGKIYKVDYTSIDNNYGHPIITDHVTNYWEWLDIRPLQQRSGKEFIKNEDLQLHYSPCQMTNILGKKYYFGLEMNADYQRDYVWDTKDKYNLIDSIFNNIDIGKFVFIHLEWNEHPKNYLYEVLDGKQRVNTITEFYENRFTYNSLFFNQLSKWEQWHFKEYHVNVAEISKITREQKIRYFLMLNTSGKIMDKEHLKKVENMLTERKDK